MPFTAPSDPYAADVEAASQETSSSVVGNSESGRFQCIGRLSRPAESDDSNGSRAPVILLLNPFALCFIPQRPAVEAADSAAELVPDMARTVTEAIPDEGAQTGTVPGGGLRIGVT